MPMHASPPVRALRKACAAAASPQTGYLSNENMLVCARRHSIGGAAWNPRALSSTAACPQTGYHSNENMLVCAPTGAGKTNVAMIAVLHELGLHLVDGGIVLDGFKIVYVAPMKALAAEVTRTFSNRLEPLGVQARLTASVCAANWPM